jgi:hypothetical protein
MNPLAEGKTLILAGGLPRPHPARGGGSRDRPIWDPVRSDSERLRFPVRSANGPQVPETRYKRTLLREYYG